jgi:Helix-turn-helix
MLEEDRSDDAAFTTREIEQQLSGCTYRKESNIAERSRALLTLIFKFIRLRHQDADADTQAFTETQQRLKGGITGASHQATKLLLIQARAPTHRVLVNLSVLGYQHFNRLAERCVRRRARWGFPFRWHEQKVYSAVREKVRAYIGYHRRRQSSAPQFGSFPVPEHNQQTANLRRLGEAFQQIRTEQGRDVAELAAATDVPAERIQALEAGTLDVDLDTMLALAKAMDLRPSAFVLRAEAIAKEAAQ